MDKQLNAIDSTIRSIHVAAIGTFFATLVFSVFFEYSAQFPGVKEISPFAKMPYSVISSVAIQISIAVGILTLARSSQSRLQVLQNVSLRKPGLVLRGIAVVLIAIVVSVIADIIAFAQRPMIANTKPGLSLAFGIVVVAFIAMVAALQSMRAVEKFEFALEEWEEEIIGEKNPLGEALDDIFFFFSLPFFLLTGRSWKPFSSELVGRSWLDPEEHYWRFIFILAFVAGIVLALAHLIGEGAAPDPIRTTIVALLFLSIETGSVIAGFLLLGGFLGLRPPVKIEKS